MEGREQLVRVLYNFEYCKDGQDVWMKEGEALSLLEKTNSDWWQVIRANEKIPFYVPAPYVEELIPEKVGKKHGTRSVPKSESRKSVPPGTDKISDRNLFKEFPSNDNKGSEKCCDKKIEIVDCNNSRRNGAAAGEKEKSEDDEEGARRLLHDKRKSWAAEELVSELTQMAMARCEPVESDYVNLRVEGERFVIASNEDEEMRVPPSLFWHSSGFAKDARHNPMSSSDELDNSDSLGQSNCVAWQSKYSLSSEGDKTDESIQSFHSLGNESVSSRQWRDDHMEDGDRGRGSSDSSPYALVLCTSPPASGVSGPAPGPAACARLRLSESLERLAQQIKFPTAENRDVEEVPPIAPPVEYEAPVYENIDLQAKATAAADPTLPGGGQQGHAVIDDEVDDDEDVVLSRDELDTPDCDISEDGLDEEEAAEEDGVAVEEGGGERAAEEEGGGPAREEWPPKPAERTTVTRGRVPAEASASERERALLEATVDVKQKIALWNSSGADRDGERQDRFDEDSLPRKAPPRTFRTLGVVKSASESKVSALVSRHRLHHAAGPLAHASLVASDSSEEFLDEAAGRPSAAWPGPLHLQLNPEGDNLDASDSGLSNKSDDVLGSSGSLHEGRRRRTSLTRNRRVESCRRLQRPPPGAPAVPRPQSPPPPSPGQEAARLLPAGWAEFRTADGRSFYYHAGSGQRRWKPPRRRPRQDSGRSASSSPLQGVQAEEADADQDGDEPPSAEPPAAQLPQGWRVVMDRGGQLCYVHPQRSNKWFSSSDDKGRVYFFEENSSESSWNLPDISSSLLQDSTLEENQNVFPSTAANGASEKAGRFDRGEKQEKSSLRTTKSRSMYIVDSNVSKDSKNSSAPRHWPQLFEGDMCILKEGPMYRTKITENGKKLRKNWASSHVVLTELFLLLFRDAKSFTAMKSASPGSSASRPELCVDLNGALIDQIDREKPVTSRKNVFLVSTVLGLQVLFQCDCSQQAEEWYNAVHTAIHNLPSGFDSCPKLMVNREMDRLFGESNSPEQTKKFPRIGRSKSVKIKNKEGSIEDLTVSVAERQTKIKARLKKFFNRRPTMESLVKKGIWKDEPAFGCYLEQVCGSDPPRVPLFVQRCIAVIESSEENMKTDGLYRASGNLSQVQKIRLQVDQNNLSALDQEEDVHVLTGALKLFFRELKEPLIPFIAFNKAIKASTVQNKKEKVNQFREIVKSLPSANHDTLKMLLKHLLKVTSYQEFNRMHIPNLAIVFGPTLMWPEQESLNMALDLMQQNLVIEAFLLDFENIFR